MNGVQNRCKNLECQNYILRKLLPFPTHWDTLWFICKSKSVKVPWAVPSHIWKSWHVPYIVFHLQKARAGKDLWHDMSSYNSYHTWDWTLCKKTGSATGSENKIQMVVIVMHNTETMMQNLSLNTLPSACLLRVCKCRLIEDTSDFLLTLSVTVGFDIVSCLDLARFYEPKSYSTSVELLTNSS